MENKILDVINNVRINSGLTPLDKISPEMDLKNDLELDSISIAELIASIDVTFNTNINEEGMIQTAGDITTRLAKL